MRTLALLVGLLALSSSADAQSLQVKGKFGYLSEFEISAAVSPARSFFTKEFTGPMTVKQSGDTLTIERTMGENKVTQTYKLDGSESKNAGRGGDVVSTAKWDGGKLVITTKTDNGDQVQTWSMEGGNLTIERTGGRGAGKMTYKKTT